MINFPSSPTLFDTHTVGAIKWTFDGVSWTTQAISFAFTSFAPQTGVEMATTITSAGQQITVPVTAAVTVSGGEWQSADDSGFTSIIQAWTSASGTIATGKYIRVRHTSPGDWLSGASTTLTIGGVSRQFNSTTRAAISIYLTTTGINNWTVPANYYSGRNIHEGIGGGATGQTGNWIPGYGNSALSGGGGAYAIAENITLTPGGSMSYTINAAVDTVAGSHLVAKGTSTPTGGQAASCTPTLNARSGQSPAAFANGGDAAGPNGLATGWTTPSAAGAGVGGIKGSASTFPTAGSPGALYGAGGGVGGTDTDNNPQLPGGAGRQGIIRITY